MWKLYRKPFSIVWQQKWNFSWRSGVTGNTRKACQYPDNFHYCVQQALGLGTAQATMRRTDFRQSIFWHCKFKAKADINSLQVYRNVGNRRPNTTALDHIQATLTYRERSECFTVVKIKVEVFLGCDVVGYQRFGGPCCFRLHPTVFSMDRTIPFPELNNNKL